MKISLVGVKIFFLWGHVLAQDGDRYFDFPDGFSIGAASAAYQIEGAWNVSDKSEGVWDHRFHSNRSLVLNGDNGDVACDSYHKYKEDVRLAKEIGLNHYRFSISWSRVLPTGSPDKISKDGIQYYQNLIDELLVNGIKPFVTLHHFDDVQSVFDKTGGWANESMVEYFADYARVMFRELGPNVKFWGTINEADVYCKNFAYLNETALNSAYTTRYLCIHNILKAHARAYHIYDKEFRPTQHGQIGLVVNSGHYVSKFENDQQSIDIAFAFEGGWLMHPVFSKDGGYPSVMKQRIAENSLAEGLGHSRLPEFSREWIAYIRGSSDYLGLNHYKTLLVEPVAKVDGRWYDDSGLIYSQDPRWPETGSGWAIYPESIGALLRRLQRTFDNPKIYVLENGMCEYSNVFDVERISYLHSYMKEVLLAIRDGCDVRAYTIWSLLDNFEWFQGYTQPFGLVHVDFKDVNRKRTPKLSSYWLKTVINRRKLIPYSDDLLEMLNSSSEKNFKPMDSKNAGKSFPCHNHILILLIIVMILSVM